jgi:hypothetical protein
MPTTSVITFNTANVVTMNKTNKIILMGIDSINVSVIVLAFALNI